MSYLNNHVIDLDTPRHLFKAFGSIKKRKPTHENATNINHKGLQRTANEYAGERRIYKDLISKNEK